MSITFDELEIEPGGDEPSGGGRRWIAAGAAALLAVAAVGVGVGYAVGRSSGDESAAGATDAEVPDTVAEVVNDGPSVPDTTVAVTTDTDTGSDTDTDSGSDSGSDESAPMEVAANDGSASMSSSGGGGYTAFGVRPLDLLAERTTPSGFVLRAHLGEIWNQAESDWGAGDWRPAAWCYESGQMRIAMVGNGVVDVGGVPWYSEAYNGRSVTWLSLGGADGSPQWVVVAQTPPDTTAVTVTFADGAVDTAIPQNGVALLTVPGVAATPVQEDGYTYWSQDPPLFDVAFEGGAEPVTVTSTGTGNWNDPVFVASCQPPPPALPDAGVQPDDAAGAEATIIQMMTELYDSTVIGEKDLYVDDPTGIGEARAEVAEGQYADQAGSAQAVVEELVFTSPTEAWFRYRIETGVNSFNARYGVAVNIDGQWKITRDTVCQDLGLAGGTCVPGSSTVFPPGHEIDVLEYTD